MAIYQVIGIIITKNGAFTASIALLDMLVGMSLWVGRSAPDGSI